MEVNKLHHLKTYICGQFELMRSVHRLCLHVVAASFWIQYLFMSKCYDKMKLFIY